MVIMRRTLACCTRHREISIDFGEHERITTYDGLERCILNSKHSCDNDSASSRGVTDSLCDDDSSSSSSNNAFGSFSSHWTTRKSDDQGSYDGNFSSSPRQFDVNEKPAYKTQFSDVETMKEKFSKLLLGEDVTGGSKGVSSALALSNAITNLAGIFCAYHDAILLISNASSGFKASVFGELWKLEPLAEEMKTKWRKELDWLLSPTSYMIELVPTKQSGSNGQRLEIMMPKARADIRMNLPALQKLDSMLLEILDTMVNTEFWYTEVSTRVEGRNTRWCVPSPKVPKAGLSKSGRKKLLNQGKLANQIFKAAKAINENILAEMPVPTIIKSALPKSGRESLGNDLYRTVMMADSLSVDEMINSLNLRSEYSALEVVNRLEGAILAWKERINEQASKSPVGKSWPFIKDPMSELDKSKVSLRQAEALLQQLKVKYPNLPRTFLNVTKIQYGTDIGHLILEAYSRVLISLALKILTRIGEILQVDISSNPSAGWRLS